MTFETESIDKLYYRGCDASHALDDITTIEPSLIGNDTSILNILDSDEETLISLINKRNIIPVEKYTIEKEIEHHYETINKLKEELELCNIRYRSLDAIIDKTSPEEWEAYYRRYDEEIDNQNKTK